MTKWLTTGEMIDALQVGEVAELEEGSQIPLKFGPSYKHITKSKDGDINWCTKEGRADNAYPVVLYGHTVNWKWRILPNYVSFSEAMEAIEEGKDVRCEFNDEIINLRSHNNKLSAICKNTACTSGGGASIKIAWINAGNWTIENV